MAKCICSLRYRCSDDCAMSGCPGHEGELRYSSVSDTYTFNMNGRELHFERGELEAMLDLLRNLSQIRADAVEIK